MTKTKGAKEKGLNQTPLEMVMLRNAFYEDAYHYLMKISLALTIFIAIVAYFGITEGDRLPSPEYFITDPEGRPTASVPINQANMSNAALLQWAGEAATSAYSFNFVNYRTRLQQTRAYFTRRGYNEFLDAIKTSDNLDAIKKNKYVVHAKQVGTASILESTETNPNLKINGAFTWLVQIPMLLTYENDNPREKISQSTVLTAYIVRQSTLISEKGVGIHSFILRQV